MLKARDWDKLLEFVIKEKHVDAIFSGNSIFAFSALNYLHRNNIRIPEDLLFATFDAAFWMYSVNSPVIAVEQDKTKLGTVAAELLIRRMSGEVFPLAEKRIDTSLILLNDA
jgi:DNA-binding LacI/PurR family transcriptional regulator